MVWELIDSLVCPPVQGDNPQALASRLTPCTGGTNHGITILYHPVSVDLAQHEIFVLKFVLSGKIIYCIKSTQIFQRRISLRCNESNKRNEWIILYSPSFTQLSANRYYKRHIK